MVRRRRACYISPGEKVFGRGLGSAGSIPFVRASEYLKVGRSADLIIQYGENRDGDQWRYQIFSQSCVRCFRTWPMDKSILWRKFMIRSASGSIFLQKKSRHV